FVPPPRNGIVNSNVLATCWSSVERADAESQASLSGMFLTLLLGLATIIIQHLSCKRSKGKVSSLSYPLLVPNLPNLSTHDRILSNLKLLPYPILNPYSV
ncbi:MAG: hypothetical protein ACUVT6_11860, partial [Thermodesulfobacteriota bacterium]